MNFRKKILKNEKVIKKIQKFFLTHPLTLPWGLNVFKGEVFG